MFFGLMTRLVFSLGIGPWVRRGGIAIGGVASLPLGCSLLHVQVRIGPVVGVVAIGVLHAGMIVRTGVGVSVGVVGTGLHSHLVHAASHSTLTIFTIILCDT